MTREEAQKLFEEVIERVLCRHGVISCRPRRWGADDEQLACERCGRAFPRPPAIVSKRGCR